MPPKVESGELSDREKYVLGLSWKCFVTEPKMDWDKLAALAGFQNPRSAQNILLAAKKKLNANIGDVNGDGGQGTATPTASPAKATPKKRTPAKGIKKRAAEDDATDEDDLVPVLKKTPTKRVTKKQKAAQTPIKGEDDELAGPDYDTVDADDEVPPVKKTPTKPVTKKNKTTQTPIKGEEDELVGAGDDTVDEDDGEI
ncbi:hypothetical protein F5Y03DRAFT_398338 [Xylaria venustula]|nr:hypothetical protein F5Y03DRAFT_398338 [Xylaria venustula]